MDHTGKTRRPRLSDEPNLQRPAADTKREGPRGRCATDCRSGAALITRETLTMGIRDSGFGTWDSGSGVGSWDLGFGTWDSGVSCRSAYLMLRYFSFSDTVGAN